MKKEPTKAAVLLSGGMDSTLALYWAKEKYDEVYALSFDYGQIHQSEFISAQRIANIANVTWVPCDLKLPDINPISNENNSEALRIPGMYLLMMILGTRWCFTESPNVLNLVYGGTKSELPDMRHRAISYIQDAIQAGFDSPNFNLWIPNLYKSKEDLIKIAVEDKQIMNSLALSQSCTLGVWPPCDRCEKCIYRAMAFSRTSIKDPIFKRSDVWQKIA